MTPHHFFTPEGVRVIAISTAEPSDLRTPIIAYDSDGNRYGVVRTVTEYGQRNGYIVTQDSKNV